MESGVRRVMTVVERGPMSTTYSPLHPKSKLEARLVFGDSQTLMLKRKSELKSTDEPPPLYEVLFVEMEAKCNSMQE